MSVLFLLLACSSVTEARARQANPAPDVPLPIPTGRVGYDYRVYTDWAPLTQPRPVWRVARWVDESVGWEEAVAGRAGGRHRKLVTQTECYRLSATTARLAAGDGGVGAGFEWEAFVGNSWTAGLELEFTATGPRVVVALTHFPIEGHTRRYGWSVLTAQVVTASGTAYGNDEARAIYWHARSFAVTQLRTLFNHITPEPRE